MMSCQKRVHASMHEMVAYLLGVDGKYCTRDVRLLYYILDKLNKIKFHTRRTYYYLIHKNGGT